MPKEATSEAHLSAERPQAGQASRIPSSYVQPGRPSGDSQSPAEGPSSAVSVTRLRGRTSFLDIRRKGVRTRAGAIGIAFLAQDGEGSARVGYAVTRRVGNAVTRNRVRRRLQAALSELVRRGDLTLRSGLYVIMPSPGVVPMGFPQLRDALAVALDTSCRQARQTGSAR